MSDDAKPAGEEAVPPLPNYGDLIWIEDPGGAVIARFNDALRLHVVPGVIGGKEVFMSGVVTAADMAMQACAFYATGLGYAKQLAYQLALVVEADFR
jgi:hypothetical protein